MKKLTAQLGAPYNALQQELCRASTLPVWWQQRRRNAWDQLQRCGLPTRAVEAWRYTDITPLTTRQLTLPQMRTKPTLPDARPFWFDDDLRIVFLDGRMVPAWSNLLHSPEVTAMPLAQLTADPDPPGTTTHPALLLHSALLSDGVVINIPVNAKLSTRLHILHIYESPQPDCVSAPFTQITVGAAARATVAVTHLSLTTAPLVTVPRLRLAALPHSHVTIGQTTHLHGTGWSLATTDIQQQRGSHLAHLEAGLGAACARHDLTVTLTEPHANVELHGIYTLQNRHHYDFHTQIEHRQPGCKSRQVYKGLIADRATAVFNGRVHVAPGAHGSDGHQLNQALLLSERAQIFSKPELLIDNDDVKCSHGATVGQLNAAELFYLQSRGIPAPQARHILARAFIDEILNQHDDLRQCRSLADLIDLIIGEMQLE